MAKNSKKIKEYLNFVKSQKEVGFMLAKNEKELKEFEKELTSSCFVKNSNIAGLGESLKSPGKNYLVLKSNGPKKVYDFLVQYPTGQIEIFDSESMKSDVIIPDYKMNTTVMLVTKKYLLKIKEEGYDLLSYAGLTYQN